MSILDEIKDVTERGKRKEIGPLVEKALADGEDPQAILDAMIAGMDVVGDKFSRGESFVPEMLVAARTMSVGTDILKPVLVESGAKPIGKAVIGTVKADMHDIGKNLVRMMIESKGVEIEDLGVDVAPEVFVDYLKNHPDCQVLCLSALLTTTMPNLGETIKALQEAGLRDQVKIMVGGAPVTQEFATSIGADAYTLDAGAAGEKIVELLTA